MSAGGDHEHRCTNYDSFDNIAASETVTYSDLVLLGCPDVLSPNDSSKFFPGRQWHPIYDSY